MKTFLNHPFRKSVSIELPECFGMYAGHSALCRSFCALRLGCCVERESAERDQDWQDLMDAAHPYLFYQ